MVSTRATHAAQCGPGALAASGYAHRSGPLTEQEMQMARIAWKYFENNTQPENGLVNAVDGYPSTTMWDTASYLGALVAAEQLHIIDRATLDKRLAAIIQTFNRLDFFRGELPNKVYNAKTTEKADYANKPGEIGYSAIDLGRLLIWLKIIKERYPEHADGIDRFVLRWKFDHVLDRDGVMYGASLSPEKKVQYVQEGRLGYEEYSAMGFRFWGFSTRRASEPEPFETVPVYCVQVPYDTRDPRKYYQHNYVVSESYVLDGLEFGWEAGSRAGDAGTKAGRDWMRDFANRVYQAQENRYKASGILTARSEHQLDQEPYFVYDTVYSDGFPWNTITDTGKYVPQFAAVSLKAALGMWVLWKSDYTDRLFAAIAKQHDPGKGFYEALLENGKGPIKAFTANNNGIMLEALLFKTQGTLLKEGAQRKGLWERAAANPYGAELRTNFNVAREPDTNAACRGDGGPAC
ncbi:DUF3131 domain-containing protein [Noviherbaspirillum pedocola]|uniref:DUF3131 domain-containing protein n=1 Tax=Noviherbaspirillum pedocola TaxID=2801341 RepID=A0A934W5U7_9BURK|nr:DUF3131 domain-containing protein [Noviherbaspirillum pedocola]MBK4735402.1 DUF3131 domain-containing protein [Noviherbaspirillum pedocola]